MDRRWALAALVTPPLRWAALVHTVPGGQPWRTGCPHCDTPFSVRPLLPPARCDGCGAQIGPRPYLLELVTLLVAGLVVVAVAGGQWPWPAAVGLAGWAAVTVPLGFVDVAVHRLPDRLTLTGAGWVLAWLGIAALLYGADTAFLRAAMAGVGCGVGFALITLIFGARGFGLGDAKLALGAGALLGWLGWTAVVAGLFLAFIGSGLVATVLLVSRRVGRKDSLPFGPFLAGGTLATLAWVGLS